MSAIDQINQGGTIYEIVPEIAGLFSITKAYHIGDHVIYEAGWYTFKADKSAGVWDATKVDGPFKVSEQLTNSKENLNDTRDVIIAKDAGINIGNLVVGSTVNSVSGANSAVNYGTRTNYIDFTVPVLIRFDFDIDTYRYDIFTYSSHAVANVVANPTNAKWASESRMLVFVPSGTAPCMRIGIIRKDKQAMTTDSADPASDFYKIKNGIKIYRITDAGLNTAGVPADSKATGDAIKIVAVHMIDDNILPVKSVETVTTNGITVKSDGLGTYKISGTASVNTVYNIYNNASAMPTNFKSGMSYRVKVDIPSIYTRFRIAYYVSGEMTTIFDSAYDGVFTIPSNAEGLAIRFFFFNNGLNNPEFEAHPQIFVDDSIGYIESIGKKSYYPPMLTIIDDDGYGYYYRDIMPLCQAKNVSISSAVVTGYMGQREGYMTWAQVQECYAAGCEILSHGYNHKTDAAILEDETTAEELEKWYRMAKHDLELHGIKSDIFVFNNNTGNLIQCQQAARRVYKAAIHAAGAEINTTAANPYYIKRYNFTAPSQGEPHTLQEMKDNIDALVSAGTGWNCWMIHTSSIGGWSADEVAKLGDAIDYARSQGVLVVTCEYAMRYYYGIV